MDIEDLVISLKDSHVGQQEIDLAIIKKQLIQNLCPTSTTGTSNNNSNNCNTPMSTPKMIAATLARPATTTMFDSPTEINYNNGNQFDGRRPSLKMMIDNDGNLDDNQGRLFINSTPVKSFNGQQSEQQQSSLLITDESLIQTQSKINQ